MSELADEPDSKSGALHWACGFKSHLRHHPSFNTVPTFWNCRHFKLLFASPLRTTPRQIETRQKLNPVLCSSQFSGNRIHVVQAPKGGEGVGRGPGVPPYYCASGCLKMRLKKQSRQPEPPAAPIALMPKFRIRRCAWLGTCDAVGFGGVRAAGPVGVAVAGYKLFSISRPQPEAVASW